MQNKESVSRAIEILRFPLAVMVVCIHCFYFNTQTINYQEAIGNGDFGSLIVRNIINILSIALTDCAVPLFFVISGYLYFFKKQDYTFTEHCSKIKKKLIVLGIPYIAWNIIAIGFMHKSFIKASLGEKLLGFWCRDFQLFEVGGPWDGPLWFIRDLLVVMLFAPLIAKAIKRFSFLLPALLCIPYLLQCYAICPGLSIDAFLFFSIGAYFAINQQITPPHCRLGKYLNVRLLYSVTAILFAARLLQMNISLGIFGKVVLPAWTFCSMATYVCIAIYIAKHTRHFETWRKLGAAGFVIYAMHTLINGMASSGMLFIIGKHNMNNWLTITVYLLTIAISTTICYCAYRLIARSPLLSKLLNGRSTVVTKH